MKAWRELFVRSVRYLFKALILSLLLAPAVCAQKQVAADPNKYAVITNGAGGDPAYAKQFEQWTAELKSALLERFTFEAKNLLVLENAKAIDVRLDRTTIERLDALINPLTVSGARYNDATQAEIDTEEIVAR